MIFLVLTGTNVTYDGDRERTVNVRRASGLGRRRGINMAR